MKPVEGMEILYLFDKGPDTFVVFRFRGSTYTRPCKLDNGLYCFRFKGQEWRCYAARKY